METGEEIDADIFFLQSFDVVTQARAEQELANQGLRSKWLVCSICGYDIRILGGKHNSESKRAKDFHFSHLHHSPDCPIKTSSKYSRADINRMKYRGQREGMLHIELKDKLLRGLFLNEQTKGQVSAIQAEKIIRSLEESEWRKPDINVHFEGKRLAIELQLSTTWLDVIVGRQHFYKESRIFILWIFNNFQFSDDTRKLAFSDIIYTNNSNAFVYDQEAYEKTLETKDLVLKCHYLHYYADEKRLRKKWLTEMITLDQLSFNLQEVKVYYKDVKSEKFLAEKEVADYIIAEEKRKQEEKQERYRQLNIKHNLERAAKRLNSEINDLETTQKEVVKNEEKLRNNGKNLTEKLSGVAKEAEELYQRMINGYWRSYPEPVNEIIKFYEKEFEQHKSQLTAWNKELKEYEQKQRRFDACQVQTVGNTTYHILDKRLHWDYIGSNTSKLVTFKKDQSTDLFSRPDVQQLQEYQLQQLQFNKNIDILADFNLAVTQNRLEITNIQAKIALAERNQVNYKERFHGEISSILTEHYLTLQANHYNNMRQNAADIKKYKQIKDSKKTELAKIKVQLP